MNIGSFLYSKEFLSQICSPVEFRNKSTIVLFGRKDCQDLSSKAVRALQTSPILLEFVLIDWEDGMMLSEMWKAKSRAG